jgi:hypothetical protein
MARVSFEDRAFRAGEVADLMARGILPHVAARKVGEKYGWDRNTCQRYINLVFATWNRDRRANRELHLSKVLAQLEAVLREAWKSERVIIEETLDEATGKIQRRRRTIPDPDFDAIVRALTTKCQLLGLNAPDKIDVFVRELGPIISDVMTTIRAHVPDPVVLGRIAREIQERIEAGSERRDVPIRVVEALPGPIAPPPEHLNGSSNGAAPHE